MKRNRQTLKLTIAGIFLTLPLLAGCASSDKGARAGAETADGTVTIQNVWARSAESGYNSAAYLQIINDGDNADRLIAAGANVAGSTEIHEAVSEEHVMKMHEVDVVDIPAGDTVDLEPGGYHVMMFDLTEELTAADEFQLVLTFDQAGEISVTAEVRDRDTDNGHGYRNAGQGGVS